MSVTPYKLPEAALSLTVTTTGQTLKDLIEAAIGSKLPSGLGTSEVYAKTGDLGYLWDGNVATAGSSILLPEGSVRNFQGRLLENISLISLEAGSITIVVQVGYIFSG